MRFMIILLIVVFIILQPRIVYSDVECGTGEEYGHDFIRFTIGVSYFLTFIGSIGYSVANSIYLKTDHPKASAGLTGAICGYINLGLTGLMYITDEKYRMKPNDPQFVAVTVIFSTLSVVLGTWALKRAYSEEPRAGLSRLEASPSIWRSGESNKYGWQLRLFF